MRKKLLTGFLASALGLASIVSGQQPPYSPSNPYRPPSAQNMTTEDKRTFSAVTIGTGALESSINGMPLKKYESVLAELDVVPIICMVLVNQPKIQGNYKIKTSDANATVITKINDVAVEYNLSINAILANGANLTYQGLKTTVGSNVFEINLLTTRKNVDVPGVNQDLYFFQYKGVAAGKAISIDTKLENRRPIESTGKWGSLDVTVAYVQDDKFPQFNKSKTVKIGTDVYRVDFSIGKQNDVLTYTGFAIEKTN